ncbi:MAG: heavy metal translocating P-type ATPase [Gammaproteobacteria bacterium]|jgi:Cu+-exporting ATPase|nr:heavy metal translocating P-type ATPase [Gammaproteobacteria bacterium]
MSNNKDKVLYFDIHGMHCQSCPLLIETNLQYEKCIKEITINLVTGRARIVVDQSTDAYTVAQLIKDVNPDKFSASWISPDNEKRLVFSISGMSSIHDVKLITEALNANKEDVKSCTVNYSTHTAIVTTFCPDDKNATRALVLRLKRDIHAAVKDHKVTAKQIQPLIKEERTKDEPAQYLRRSLINALVGVALILFSGFIPLPLTLSGQLIGLFIGGVTFGVMWQTGKEFFTDAWREFRQNRSSNMNTLIALGTGSAWLYSMLLVIAPMLFPVAALSYHFLAINMILGIINLGKGIRANAQEQSKSKVQNLAQVYIDLQPQTALVLKNEHKKRDLNTLRNEDFVEIPYLKIKEGDIIQVRRDERVPVEGIIVSDTKTMMDQATLTGESGDCEKRKGDEVFSGSWNKKHTILFRATKNGPEGYLTRVIADVDKSSASKPSISKLVDRLAVVFVPSIVAVSVLSAAGWFVFGPVPALPWMIKSAMSVLLCACPCALGLATPISTAISTFMFSIEKILVKDASAIEVASTIDTVVFDKTGTLTKPEVRDVYIGENAGDWDKATIMQYVASLEKGFDHPIAKSLMKEGVYKELIPCVDAMKAEQGVSGKVNNLEVLVGNLSHLESNGIDIPEHYKVKENQNSEKGLTSIYVAIDGECVAVASLKHNLCPDAKKTVQDLQARNIEVIMLTGDKKEPANAVAKLLGIKKVNAEFNSQQKKQFIENLKKKNRIVAMVGDGINDLEAMKAADLSIAVGSWTHASSAAHVATQKLNFIPGLIIAEETMKNIHQNLYWTGFYNLLSLTAATGLLYPLFGFVLNPVIASISMGLSSIFVVLNSMRLTYNIDYAVGVYEKSITEPATFFAKLLHMFSFRGLFQALEMVFTFSPQHLDKKSADKEMPSLTSQSPKKSSNGSLPAQPNYRKSPPSSPSKFNHSSRNPIQIKMEDAGKRNTIVH